MCLIFPVDDPIVTVSPSMNATSAANSTTISFDLAVTLVLLACAKSISKLTVVLPGLNSLRPLSMAAS